MKTRRALLVLAMVSVVITGCVGIPQRIRDRDRPGHWKCTATDIGASIYFFPVYTVPALIDLPFGFVVDVACLPFDARNTRKQEADRRFWLDYFDRGVPLASAEEGRRRLSFMGRQAVESRIAQSPPLNKNQLADLMAIGFALKVAESQPLDEELIVSSIGMSHVLSNGTLAQHVARNPGTPLSILEQMVAADSALPQLIENPNMTPDLLSRVAAIAAERLASSERFFRWPGGAITYTDLLSRTEAALARNPRTPASLLESLSRDPSLYTLKALAENPNTPWTVLVKIARDGPNPYIRKLASSTLSRKKEANGNRHDKPPPSSEAATRPATDPNR